MTSPDTRALTAGFAAAAAMLWLLAIWAWAASPATATADGTMLAARGPSTKVVVLDAKRTKQKAARAKSRTAAAAAEATKPKKKPNPNGFVWPVEGDISSPFGPRGSGFHHGTDIECSMGEKVRAARAGRVILSSNLPVYGHTVVLQHADGWSTLYGHFSKRSVANGEKVVRGQVVGRCGSSGNSTGPHLHFEIRRNGRFYAPSTLLP